MRNQIFSQLVLLSLGMIIFSLMGSNAVLSSIYGSSIAIINYLLLSRRIKLNQLLKNKNAESDIRSIYIGAIERFVFTLIAMAVGMGALSFEPMAILVSFALMQLSYFFAPINSQIKPESATSN
ncbi:MAG: ATP synthase subunit I [Methylococcales bacterium]|jgi:F0F1-type ATP synthase assembly protein I|nr:ATP synthase subunit I [Methylococcales bacterium]MBT7411304.1 ATP synthase subunit I [Methylococcales bacterium]